MKLPAIVIYPLAAAAAIFLGRVELRSDDAGIEALLILVVSFALGSLYPRGAWRMALIIGSAIPLADLLARRNTGPLLALFTLGIAMAASLAGAAIRKTRLS